MADSVTLEVKGLNRTENYLRRLGAQVPKDVTDETQQWGDDFAGDLRRTPYPAPRPGSRYVRTYRLKRTWRAKRIRRGTEILNRAGVRSGGMYARYPVGDAQGRGQAWMHRGHWWRFADKLKPALKQLRERLEKRIQKAIDRGI